MVFGEAHSCAGKRKVFSSELMLLSLKIINLKGSCFWLRENIEFYNENSNFGKTHFSLERVKRSLNGNRLVFIDSIAIDESDKIDKINTSSASEYRFLSIDRLSRYRLKSMHRF